MERHLVRAGREKTGQSPKEKPLQRSERGTEKRKPEERGRRGAVPYLRALRTR